MLKVATLMTACFVSCASAAYADAFRPGASGSGGRIGKVCTSDLMTRPEQEDCIDKMKAAKNEAERREVRDLIRDALKARQKDLDIKTDNLNIGRQGR